jgi:DNA replication protein DnaC
MRKKKGIESVSLSEEIRQNLFILDCQQFFINIQKKKEIRVSRVNIYKWHCRSFRRWIIEQMRRYKIKWVYINAFNKQKMCVFFNMKDKEAGDMQKKKI